MTIRGAREFIKKMQDQMNRRKMKDGTIVDTKTGEIITPERVEKAVDASAKILNDIQAKKTEPEVPEGATKIEDIIG